MNVSRCLGVTLAVASIGMALQATQPALAAERPRSGAACAPYATPIVLDFKTLSPAPIYNNRLTIQGIRNLFRSHTDAVVGPHASALGITNAQTTYTAEARSSATTTRGGYCVYLTGIDVTFGWRRMEVYVASEFAPGSCEYKTILDHENQHVAVNTGALKEYAPRFRAELEKMLRAQQPVFTVEAQAGTDAALARIESRMSDLLEQFQKTMASRNAPLDSADNYGATAKMCANWGKAGPAGQ